MDLTFGDHEKDDYGGILLRGIREAKRDGKFINGSLNVRNALSNQNPKVSTEELRKTIALQRDESTSSKIIFVSTRIGLKDKSFREHQIRITHNDEFYKGQGNSKFDSFIIRKYRFITDVCPDNKFRDKIKVAENSINVCGFNQDYVNDLYQWKVIKS